MGSRIQVLLNVPRTELLVGGWGKSRLASSMNPCTLGNKDGTDVYIPSALPKNLWKEPNTGVIMLRPGPLDPQWWEREDDPIITAARLQVDKWYRNNTGPVDPLLGIPGNFSIVTRREGSASDLVDILATVALQAILAEFDSEMRWVMQTTDPFVENEGISVWVRPLGIYTDRATDYMAIAFGGRYCLNLQMNGSATLYVLGGTNDAPTWRRVETFSYSSGGVDHTKPFQLTIIPWGKKYITFLFSQSTTNQTLAVTAVKGQQQYAYLYDIEKYEGFTPRWDNDKQMYIKTEAQNLTVGLRRKLYNYGFSWARVRYPQTETLRYGPERLPELKPQADTATMLTRRGYEGHNNGGSGTSISTSLFNENGVAFNPNNDTTIVPRFVFQADSNRLYTPELWSADYKIDPLTHTPSWTPVDISDKWTFLRFQRTLNLDVCTAEAKLENSENYDHCLTGWGPLQINVLDQTDTPFTAFDGYIYYRQPTLTGPLVINEDQIAARDMWLRLNERLVPDYRFLDGLYLLDTIVELIKHAGFVDSDIVVSDPGGYLAGIYFGGFIDPNDQKGFNQDTSIGDVLRQILESYTPLPIRVRVIRGKWNIYLAPQYDPGTPPTKKFFLKSGLTSVVGDLDRFLSEEYFVLSNPEFTVEEPAFNGLICRGATTTGADGELIESVIPALFNDPRSINDPSYAGFMGRAKVVTKAPPEIVAAQTQGELDRITRAYYERHHRRRPILEFAAEWQPEVDVDQFVWIIGINPDGQRVSYGAWRVEHLDVQCMFDGRDETGNPAWAYHAKFRNTDQRWSYEGNYTCVYVGKAEDVDTPMFTTDDKLPL